MNKSEGAREKYGKLVGEYVEELTEFNADMWYNIPINAVDEADFQQRLSHTIQSNCLPCRIRVEQAVQIALGEVNWDYPDLPRASLTDFTKRLKEARTVRRAHQNSLVCRRDLVEAFVLVGARPGLNSPTTLDPDKERDYVPHTTIAVKLPENIPLLHYVVNAGPNSQLSNIIKSIANQYIYSNFYLGDGNNGYGVQEHHIVDDPISIMRDYSNIRFLKIIRIPKADYVNYTNELVKYDSPYTTYNLIGGNCVDHDYKLMHALGADINSPAESLTPWGWFEKLPGAAIPVAEFKLQFIKQLATDVRSRFNPS